jgi:hypothetical protein
MKSLSSQNIETTGGEISLLLKKGPPVLGYLHIRIIEGKLIRNTELFGNMDPFVQVDYRGKSYKT